jgi:hypothetical protein
MRVRILRGGCEPSKFDFCCPGKTLATPVEIVGERFSSLTHFLLFNMFAEVDAAYAQLFTHKNEQHLVQAYERLFPSMQQFSNLGSGTSAESAFALPNPLLDKKSQDQMLDFMRQRLTYLEYNHCVDSPYAIELFRELDARLKRQATEWMKTWIKHRFANVDLDRNLVFESQDYVQYAKLLTDYCQTRPLEVNPADVTALAKVLMKPEPQLELFDMVFGEKPDRAKARTIMRETNQPSSQAKSVFQQLATLLVT